jgi:hypothetical protein
VQIVLVQLGAIQAAGQFSDYLLESGLGIADNEDVPQVVTVSDFTHELTPLVGVEKYSVDRVRVRRPRFDASVKDGAAASSLEP